MTAGSTDDPAALLDELQSRGIRLHAAGERLTFTARPGALDDRLRAAIAARRPELLALLAARQPIELPPRTGLAPLTAGQLQILLLEQRRNLGATYHLPVHMSLDHPCDVGQLERAWAMLIHRHEGLRTVFPTVDVSPIALVLPVPPACRIERVPDAAVFADVAARPFDFVAGPLWRVALDSSGRNVLLVIHHIVADGQALAILCEELASLLAGESLPQPPSWTYADFARWQALPCQQDAIAQGLDAIYAVIAGAEPLALPSDLPRGSQADHRGQTLSFRIAADVVAGIEHCGRGLRTGPNALLVAAFATVLGRAASSNDVTIGVVDRGRPFPELERVVGHFANPLPLRLRFRRGEGFFDRVRHAAEGLSWLRTIAHVPFSAIVERHSEVVPSGSVPFVQHSISVLDALRDTPAGRLQPVAMKVARFETLWSVRRDQDGITAMIEAADRYAPASVARLGEAFAALLGAAAGGEDFPPDQVLPGARSLLTAPAEGFGDDDLVSLLLASVRLAPERLCVTDDETNLTGRDLLDRSATIAAALSGFPPGARIGLWQARSAALVSTIVGIFRAGLCYVPLDPANPPERLQHMVRVAGLTNVIADASPPLEGVRVIRIDALPPSADRADPTIHPDALAYIMHSSGSTGAPKPIGVGRAALAHFLAWTRRQWSNAEMKHVLAITGIGFDISLFELLAPLASGGVVHVDRGDILSLARGIPDGVTLLNTVPSIADALAAAHALPASLRTINLAGEALPAALVERLHRLRPDLCILNLYGPTEATIYATVAEIVPGAPVTIGQPVAGARIALLDAGLDPVIEGAAGTLAIAGPLLARGYLGEPARTAELFVPDPLGTPGSRRYLTGDRAMLRDGALHYLGRGDRQVKVNGVRIELAEVEAALALLPLRQSAVLAFEKDGRSRLAALVVPADGSGWDDSAMRAHLSRHLPSAMLPQLIRVDELPRLPNGKLDRARAVALAALGGRHDPPATYWEREVAAVWTELLGTGPPSRDDQFFASGGDSLRAIRLVQKVNERFGTSLSGAAPFEHPTLAALAAAAEAASHAPDSDALDAPNMLDALVAEIAALSDEEVAARLRGLQA